jgi:predicted Fe-Mo cluster-binding NifX family protein
MIIAIATNDRETIAKRTGRAEEFAFFTIEDDKIIQTVYQKNTHEHHDHERNEGHHRQGQERHGYGHGYGHGHNHDNHTHDEVVKQLKEVTIFLVRAVGKNMKRDLDKGNIPYKLVKGEKLSEIISNYLKEVG